jgi:hypothetical protein
MVEIAPRRRLALTKKCPLRARQNERRAGNMRRSPGCVGSVFVAPFGWGQARGLDVRRMRS